MLTKNAARTLAPLGVRVNSIGPGFIDTNMTAAIDEVDEYSTMSSASRPMGRKGKPIEIANVALFWPAKKPAMSPANSSIPTVVGSPAEQRQALGGSNGVGSRKRRITLVVIWATSLSKLLRARAPNHEIEPTENTAPPPGVS